MPETTITNLKWKLLDAAAEGTPAYKVAAACQMHPYTLSRYALGKSVMQPVHLRALCRYFECSQQELLGTSTFDYDDDEP